MATSETHKTDVSHLGSGEAVLMAGTGKVLGSFAVDIAAIGVLAAVAFFIASGSTYNEWLPVAAALGTWIGGSAVYGMVCFPGRTLGCLATGTAYVRDSDGGRPGPFLMSWIAVLTFVFVVVWIFGIIISGGSGTSGGGTANKRPLFRHINIDDARRQRTVA